MTRFHVALCAAALVLTACAGGVDQARIDRALATADRIGAVACKVTPVASGAAAGAIARHGSAEDAAALAAVTDGAAIGCAGAAEIKAALTDPPAK